jgi:N-acetylmuramoyl-L-alanine amidase
MKRTISIFFRFFLMSFVVAMQTIPQASASVQVNNLTAIEIATGTFVTHTMFNFSAHTKFIPHLNQEKFELTLAFPHSKIQKIDTTQIESRLKELNDFGIKNITFTEDKTTESLFITIAFEKNEYVAKWYRLEEGKRLELEIYDKSKFIAFCQKQLNNQTRSSNKTANKKRIIIDPGHGGSARGASWYGYQEAIFNLDIAKRLAVLLQQAGFDVVMTHEQDIDVSLPQRAQHALQMEGDLFVSIHNNSTGMTTDKKVLDKIHGTESYYFNAREALFNVDPEHFWFINTQPDDMLALLICQNVEQQTQQSRILADTIQKSVLQSIQKSGNISNDRGIKTAHFRVLLLSTLAIPAVLLELGFMSNEEEVNRLANPSYRQSLAEGICSGILSFFCH